MSTTSERAERKQAESQQALAERLLHQLRNRGALEERLAVLKRFDDRNSPVRLTVTIVVSGFMILLGLFQIVNVGNHAAIAGEHFGWLLAGGIAVVIAGCSNLLAFYFDRRYGRSERLVISTLLGLEEKVPHD